MNRIIKLMLLLIGLSVGWGASWVSSYFETNNEVDLNIELEKIFKYSTTGIKEEADSCEGLKHRTVGSVLGSIFGSNMERPKNSVSLLCYEQECGLIYNDCKPWQTQECGSRILRFGLNEDMEIDPSTFACVDMP